MGLILCIETGTEVCSVALARDGRLLSLAESDRGRDHARQAAVFVQEILREHGLRAGELDAVAVSSGPGSYTGLRIGVSLAKGICYGAGVPLIAVGSLEALAHTALEDSRAGIVNLGDPAGAHLCPMIDARRMEVYAQVFDGRLQALSPVVAEVVEAESFAAWRGEGELVIFGDGAAKCAEVLAGNIRLVEVTPSARGQVALAEAALQAGRFEDTAYFEPFYLKDFIIKNSTKKLL